MIKTIKSQNANKIILIITANYENRNHTHNTNYFYNLGAANYKTNIKLCWLKKIHVIPTL